MVMNPQLCHGVYDRLVDEQFREGAFEKGSVLSVEHLVKWQ
jgi:hypothetical protein